MPKDRDELEEFEKNKAFELNDKTKVIRFLRKHRDKGFTKEEILERTDISKFPLTSVFVNTTKLSGETYYYYKEPSPEEREIFKNTFDKFNRAKEAVDVNEFIEEIKMRTNYSESEIREIIKEFPELIFK